MKYFQDNRSMTLAIAASLLLHAALLAVRFVAPDRFRFEPLDPGLEVILVNAKHAAKPLKADALAQANLDGGGNAEAGRAKSPLADLHKVEDGQAVKLMERRSAEVEEQRKHLMSTTAAASFNVAPVTEKSKPDPLTHGADADVTNKVLARLTAEVVQTIDDQNKRPRKTYITPSTREVGYAMYYTEMTKRIEKIGTLNFPNQNGRKLYGELIVSIPVFQDGTIYEKEGGVYIKKTSGNKVLDAKAIDIVRRSAPFGRFPPKMLSSDKDDLWVIITTFKFTHMERLETEHFLDPVPGNSLRLSHDDSEKCSCKNIFYEFHFFRVKR